MPELPYKPTLSERVPGPFLIFRAFLLTFNPAIFILSAAASLLCYSLGLWSPGVYSTGAMPLSQKNVDLSDVLPKMTPLTQPHFWEQFLLPSQEYYHGEGWTFVFQIAGSVVLWSFVSLAICRIAAVKLTVGDGVSVFSACKWALSKYASWLGATMIILTTGCFFGFVAWLGLRIPYLNVWLFPVWYLSFGLGIIVFIASYLSFHLISPALMTENCDCFDAASRSFAYATQKPFQLIGYIFFTLLIWNFGGLLLINILDSFNDSANLWLQNAKIEVTPYIHGCMLFVWLIQMYVLNAFWFTSASAMYLLLRFKIDKVELDEVWLQAPYGLPRHKLPEIKNKDSSDT